VHLYTEHEGQTLTAAIIGSASAAADAIIRKDNFWDVVQGSYTYINNSRDKKKDPFDHSEIVKRAKSKIGTEGYNLFSNNCEHFCNWCRYDEHTSEQADKAQTTAILAAAGVGLLAATFIGYKLTKKPIKEKETQQK
jgi:hypothetical protein